jgi:hypothetical protein
MMSRSFRTIREGREALRRARQESGMETLTEVKEEVMEQPPVQPQVQEESATVATSTAPAVVVQPTAELEAAELALRKAKIRRENAAMVQACAMAVFAGLSAVAVGIGMIQKTNKTTTPAAAPSGPAAK